MQNGTRAGERDSLLLTNAMDGMRVVEIARKASHDVIAARRKE